MQSHPIAGRVPVLRRAGVLLSVAATALTGCAAVSGSGGPANAGTPSTRAPITAQVPEAGGTAGGGAWPASERSSGPAVGYPESGGGSWDIVEGQGAVAGGQGPLLRYQVAVERDITGLDRRDFGDAVAATLADPRSWTATGHWRLQRVGPGQPTSFTIYLATPATRDQLCRSSYDRYTSCRRDNAVVLNVARWAHGVPFFGEDLASYRQYMVNHEVGHRLGQGHERCPGAGRPAPLMQQQTLGLHGCLPNPWPMVNGLRYAGPSGQYDDPIPR
jgi:hypothetical protein